VAARHRDRGHDRRDQPERQRGRPFLAVEQAALSQITPDSRRTSVFAWFNLAG